MPGDTRIGIGMFLGVVGIISLILALLAYPYAILDMGNLFKDESRNREKCEKAINLIRLTAVFVLISLILLVLAPAIAVDLRTLAILGPVSLIAIGPLATYIHRVQEYKNGCPATIVGTPTTKTLSSGDLPVGTYSDMATTGGSGTGLVLDLGVTQTGHTLGGDVVNGITTLTVKSPGSGYRVGDVVSLVANPTVLIELTGTKTS